MSEANEKKVVEVKNWFADPTVRGRVDAMTDGDMKSWLLNLVGTDQFIAILKYAQSRVSIAQQGLFTLDPFRDQTQMARMQGIMTGLLDLPDAIAQLHDQAEKIENTPVAPPVKTA